MANGDNYPIKAKVSSWRRWEDEFNAGFAGKALVYGVQAEPARPVRLTGSLNTRSHWCWYGFKRLPPAFQPPHRIRVARIQEEKGEAKE
jgi:hypothetical protein